jgi:hypothetical protein
MSDIPLRDSIRGQIRKIKLPFWRHGASPGRESHISPEIRCLYAWCGRSKQFLRGCLWTLGYMCTYSWVNVTPFGVSLSGASEKRGIIGKYHLLFFFFNLTNFGFRSISVTSLICGGLENCGSSSDRIKYISHRSASSYVRRFNECFFLPLFI